MNFIVVFYSNWKGRQVVKNEIFEGIGQVYYTPFRGFWLRDFSGILTGILINNICHKFLINKIEIL
jgi:hypothetical protein